MPAICDPITSSLSQSFKKNETTKESFEASLAPSAKQILNANIEYEQVESYSSTVLSNLQTKYIVLKPDQPNLSSSILNGSSTKSLQNGTNGKSHQNGTITSTQSQLPQPKKILFPRENVQIGWRMNLSCSGRKWGPGCGFRNVGNTCYLNSALQAFIHVPAIAQWLMSDREHRENECGQGGNTQFCVICAMSKTLILSQKEMYAMVPNLIAYRLNSICKHMTHGRQEDAHEFLRYLVDQMEKAYLNRFKHIQGFKDLDQFSKETTPLNQILGGYLRSTVKCQNCKYESITFQHFEDLPLDISKVSTLEDALNGYFSRENLEESGYKCESCKKRVSATKQFSLERTPVVLCIQLKRFTAMGGKLGKQVEIKEYLSLKNFITKSGDQNQGCKYKLVSMVTHLGGSASGGHYTAVGLAPNGIYYHFDDDRVNQGSLSSVLRTNAYVLFYELTSTVSQQNSPLSNGQSVVHQNGHTYSKKEIISTISPTSTKSDFDRLRQSDPSFAKPNLPKLLVPSALMKQQQQNQLKKKENETTPPPKSQPSTPNKSPVPSPSGTAITMLFPAVKTNGKREASDGDNDDDDIRNEMIAKRMKPSMPSVPRLLSADDDVDDKSNSKCANQSTSLCESALSSPLATPVKSPTKSLVPYETDDESDMEKDESNVNFCKTSSGVFVETDLKENSSPSKTGSTLENTKVIDTKASLLANGSSTSNGGLVANGKGISHSHFVNKNDDAFAQLKKLNHSGYGTSEVKSWSDTPSAMNRVVIRDQQEERKRQFEDEEELEIDGGRQKKIKSNNRNDSNRSNLLPNPFQEHQNRIQQPLSIMKNHYGGSYSRGENRNERYNNDNRFNNQQSQPYYNQKNNHNRPWQKGGRFNNRHGHWNNNNNQTNRFNK